MNSNQVFLSCWLDKHPIHQPEVFHCFRLTSLTKCYTEVRNNSKLRQNITLLLGLPSSTINGMQSSYFAPIFYFANDVASLLFPIVGFVLNFGFVFYSCPNLDNFFLLLFLMLIHMSACEICVTSLALSFHVDGKVVIDFGIMKMALTLQLSVGRLGSQR